MHHPEPNEIYRHFKGNLYRIVTLATHSETGEQMVVYQALYGDMPVYVRPLALFMSPVDREKYPQADQQYRFEPASRSVELQSAPQQPVSQQPAPQSAFPQAQDGFAETAAAAAATDPVQERAGIDPLVMEFLESDTYEEKLNILAALHAHITDDMINTMAIAVDVEIEDADVQERYEQLRSCLLTFNKFECSRMR